ncbi:MAG: glycosyltransferase, partial [Candidatus Aegiribacteria sp.]|nr:glycosyltransferase [Candidatus Aegiribacteria sp.]
MRPLYEGIRQHCDFHLMFIDDASPDNTAGRVRDLMKNDPSVHILERSEKEGLGNAYMDAFRHIGEQDRWDRIFTMDADQSH